MRTGDTIAAISSGAVASARIIVRLSGPGAFGLAGALCPGWGPAAGAGRATLELGDLRCPAWLYGFVGPRSYTGEDLIELHVPGNVLLARMTLNVLLARGARLADPGEFTARAYFNGRMDLTEAEGVAATIAAQSDRELAAARQLLAGALARRLRPTMDLLADALALVEVGIDFSDEGVTFLSPAQLAARLDEVRSTLDALLADSARFEQLSHEPQVVLVGRPNAGKSTLLNALAGHERAVVSAIEGTTRDVLSAHIFLPRGVVRLVDVAGVDDEPATPPPVAPQADIAQHMRRRALQAVQEADAVLLVRDSADPRPPVALQRRPDRVVATKIDLTDPPAWDEPRALRVSATTGRGMSALREALDELAFGPEGAGAGLALNARHLAAIDEAQAALAAARQRVSEVGPELIALDLRQALDALGQILGTLTPDDLLGRVFARFCIGK